MTTTINIGPTNQNTQIPSTANSVSWSGERGRGVGALKIGTRFVSLYAYILTIFPLALNHLLNRDHALMLLSERTAQAEKC